MYKYLIIFEKTKTGYSAYSPDVPGCIATGSTKKNTEKNMIEAIEFHIDGLVQEGIEIPKPLVSAVEFINFQFDKTSNKHLAIA